MNADEAKRGSRIKFSCDGNGGKVLVGEVMTFDANGGGVSDGICPSVDVLSDDGILYKHVPISKVREELQ